MKKTFLIVFIVGVFALFIFLSNGFINYVSATTKYDFGTTTLKNGSKGEAVKELQRFLNNTMNLGLAVDGKLGPKTILVIKQWQRDHGLVSDGLIGTKTKAIMNNIATSVTNGSSIAVPPVTQTNTNVQNQLITYQLQSAFFRSDTNAQNILAGKNISINTDSYNPSSFEWKFLNGLRQVGYTRDSSLLPNTSLNLLGWLHKFQRLNNLTQVNKIGAEELIKLDQMIFARETNDAKIATNFPLSGTVVGGSPNEPSITHIKTLFVLALQALPTSLIKWNNENMSNFLHLQGQSGAGYGFEYRPQGICFMTYFTSLNGECNPTSSTTIEQLGLFKDDMSMVYTFIHEYAHYLDGYMYDNQQDLATSRGIINTNEFRAISYDTSNNCNPDSVSSNWGFFRLKNPGNEKNEFLTQYAAFSIRKTGDEGCRSSSEDFAESFTMYIMQGNTFRKLAETKPVIAQKYTWLKNNVFGGKEYFTGNSQNIALINQALTAPYSQLLPAFNDYFTIDPNFVWNYQF